MVKATDFLEGHSNSQKLREPQPSAAPEIAAYVFGRGHVALRHLLDACQYARELHRTRWDFAVQIGDLQRNGLTNNDLRWMVCKAFVEHAQETTKFDDEERTFHNEGGLRFSEKTFFILTDAGISYIRRFSDWDTRDVSAEAFIAANSDISSEPIIRRHVIKFGQVSQRHR